VCVNSLAGSNFPRTKSNKFNLDKKEISELKKVYGDDVELVVGPKSKKRKSDIKESLGIKKPRVHSIAVGKYLKFKVRVK